MVVGDEAKSAESQAACHTLAHELTEQRFPAPRMLSFKVLPCTFELWPCNMVWQGFSTYLLWNNMAASILKFYTNTPMARELVKDWSNGYQALSLIESQYSETCFHNDTQLSKLSSLCNLDVFAAGMHRTSTCFSSFFFFVIGCWLGILPVKVASTVHSILEAPHSCFSFSQEGSSQARYLQSRLIPARKDPPYEQVGFIALLACLSEMFFWSFWWEIFEVSFVDKFVMPLRFRVFQLHCPWMGNELCRISQLCLLSVQPIQLLIKGIVYIFICGCRRLGFHNWGL